MEYSLIRSDRKTLSVQITRNAEVVVHAPKKMPQSTIDAFVKEHGTWIEKKVGERQAFLDRFPAELTPAEEKQLRHLANQVLPARVAHYAARMGVTPKSVSVNGACARYGSCSSKGDIHFSFRLMRFPAEAVDYVVVHELAHLLHMNHSRAFWDTVASVLPDYRQRQNYLEP